MEAKMNRLRRSLLLGLLFTVSTGAAAGEQLRVSPLRNDCSLDGFSESDTEYMIEDLAEPFRVRAVKGTIDSEGGEWPGTSLC